MPCALSGVPILLDGMSVSIQVAPLQPSSGLQHLHKVFDERPRLAVLYCTNEKPDVYNIIDADQLIWNVFEDI